MDQSKAKEHLNGFVAEIDQAELAVRLIERGCHMKRTDGLGGIAAWEQLRQAAAAGKVPGYILDDFWAMAHIAIAYFGECIESAHRHN